ncbi:KEOPS complex subunit Cgi121 [Halobacterium hubeiense]|uniref:KEOPS complex subunit Cgi121 n=1 Tax=Halobacterium hubeiense TaxID=1407499 RepID=UPI003C708F4C
MRLVAGTAAVDDVESFVADLPGGGPETAVQAFDAAYVAGRAHLAAAVEHADRAFDRGENVASDRAVEILLYAAGRRQIREALGMGVVAGEQPVVVVVAGGDEAEAAADVAAFLGDGRVLEEDEPGGDGVYGDSETIREFFDVSDAELAAAAGDLAGVVRERVALLDVEK